MLIISYLLALVCPQSCPPWCRLPAGHAPDHVDSVDGSVATIHRAPVLADHPDGRRLDLVQTSTVRADGSLDPGDPLVMLDGRPDELLTLDQARRYAEALTLAADLVDATTPAPAVGGAR